MGRGETSETEISFGAEARVRAPSAEDRAARDKEQIELIRQNQLARVAQLAASVAAKRIAKDGSSVRHLANAEAAGRMYVDDLLASTWQINPRNLWNNPLYRLIHLAERSQGEDPQAGADEWRPFEQMNQPDTMAYGHVLAYAAMRPSALTDADARQLEMKIKRLAEHISPPFDPEGFGDGKWAREFLAAAREQMQGEALKPRESYEAR